MNKLNQTIRFINSTCTWHCIQRHGAAIFAMRSQCSNNVPRNENDLSILDLWLAVGCWPNVFQRILVTKLPCYCCRWQQLDCATIVLRARSRGEGRTWNAGPDTLRYTGTRATANAYQSQLTHCKLASTCKPARQAVTPDEKLERRAHVGSSHTRASGVFALPRKRISCYAGVPKVLGWDVETGLVLG